MSQIGNIKTTYGQSFNVAVANVDGNIILKGNNLPKNSLIISAPNKEYDLGTYTMFVTDAFGAPVRLTYTVKPGNGLNTSGDDLYISLDDITIKTNNEGQLTVDIANLIDNDTIIYNNGVASVDTQKLDIATDLQYGVVSVDECTIKVDNDGKISVDTLYLQRANNTEYGVVTSDNNTINIDNDGVISVVTSNLDKSTQISYGVSKTDNVTIISNNGIYSVNTNNLDKASSTNYGVSKTDNSTISNDNGIYSVNTYNLTHASSSEYGIVKFDGTSIIETNNGLSINDNEMMSYIYDCSYGAYVLSNRVNEMKEMLSDSIMFNNKHRIYSVTCNHTTTALLNKPQYLEEPINMPLQHIYVSLNIVTNCDFNINVIYEGNESPNVELQQINYSDDFATDGVDGLHRTYPSTNMNVKEVVLHFYAKNFKSTTAGYINKTKMNIIIAASDNSDIYENVKYCIVRYNSYINTELLYEDDIDSNEITYSIDLGASYAININDVNKTQISINGKEGLQPGTTYELHLAYRASNKSDNEYYVIQYNTVSDTSTLYNYSVGKSTSQTVMVSDDNGKQHLLVWNINVEPYPENMVVLLAGNSVMNEISEKTSIDVYKYSPVTLNIYQRYVNDDGKHLIQYKNGDEWSTYGNDTPIYNTIKIGDNTAALSGNDIAINSNILISKDESKNVDTLLNNESGSQLSLYCTADSSVENVTFNVCYTNNPQNDINNNKDNIAKGYISKITAHNVELAVNSTNKTYTHIYGYNYPELDLKDCFEYTYTIGDNTGTFSNILDPTTNNLKFPSIIVTPLNISDTGKKYTVNDKFIANIEDYDDETTTPISSVSFIYRINHSDFSDGTLTYTFSTYVNPTLTVNADNGEVTIHNAPYVINSSLWTNNTLNNDTYIYINKVKNNTTNFKIDYSIIENGHLQPTISYTDATDSNPDIINYNKDVCKTRYAIVPFESTTEMVDSYEIPDDGIDIDSITTGQWIVTESQYKNQIVANGYRLNNINFPTITYYETYDSCYAIVTDMPDNYIAWVMNSDSTTTYLAKNSYCVMNAIDDNYTLNISYAYITNQQSYKTATFTYAKSSVESTTKKYKFKYTSMTDIDDNPGDDEPYAYQYIKGELKSTYMYSESSKILPYKIAYWIVNGIDARGQDNVFRLTPGTDIECFYNRKHYIISADNENKIVVTEDINIGIDNNNENVIIYTMYDDATKYIYYIDKLYNGTQSPIKYVIYDNNKIAYVYSDTDIQGQINAINCNNISGIELSEVTMNAGTSPEYDISSIWVNEQFTYYTETSGNYIYRVFTDSSLDFGYTDSTDTWYDYIKSNSQTQYMVISYNNSYWLFNKTLDNNYIYVKRSGGSTPDAKYDWAKNSYVNGIFSYEFKNEELKITSINI